MIDALKRIMAEYPFGSVVYHRANDRRGIVVEFCLAGDGSIMLMVAFGPGASWEKCLPCELSAVRSLSDDGDDWKAASG